MVIFHRSLEAIQILMQLACEIALLQNEVIIKNIAQFDQEIFALFPFFIHA